MLDGQGAVLGMLLPTAPQSGKQLPVGVGFALAGSEITRLLAPSGVVPQTSVTTAPLSPAALAETGTGMTALVSCWD